MNEVASLLRSNPFSTHLVRPGAIPYAFEPDASLSQLLTRLRTNRWRGQIVGPHGSGKTTLLRTLDASWEEQQRVPQAFSLRDGQRALPPIDWPSVSRATQFVVDGFEQLSTCSRLLLALRVRIHGCGLLVTTHWPTTLLAEVHRSKTSLSTFTQITKDRVGQQVTRGRIRQTFENCDGNVREAFMQLYDLIRDENA